MSFVDKTLTCIDCARPFTFTAGEQELHQSKGSRAEPQRCEQCRAERKSSGPGRREPRGRVELTCATCGKPAHVPFKPRQGRPVYCKDCFQAQPKAAGAAPRAATAAQNAVTLPCSACGNPAHLPFEPRDGRPVYCSDCFQPQPKNLTNDFPRNGARFGAFRNGYAQRGAGGGQYGNRGNRTFGGGARGQRNRSNRLDW